MNDVKTICLVDDDRMLIRETFEGIVKNVKIVEVIDGQELLELIEKRI